MTEAAGAGNLDCLRFLPYISFYYYIIFLFSLTFLLYFISHRHLLLFFYVIYLNSLYFQVCTRERMRVGRLRLCSRGTMGTSRLSQVCIHLTSPLPSFLSFLSLLRSPLVLFSSISISSLSPNLRIFRYAHENGCEWDDKTCMFAAGNSSVSSLLFYSYFYFRFDILFYFIYIMYWWIEIGKGHLDCLMYAHENGCQWNASFICTIAAGEYLLLPPFLSPFHLFSSFTSIYPFIYLPLFQATGT